MKCIACKLEIEKLITVLNEYLHIHSNDHDSLMEGSKITQSCVENKISSYCNLLESIDHSKDFSKMIFNIRNIDITEKTYNQVRKEIFKYYTEWLNI